MQPHGRRRVKATRRSMRRVELRAQSTPSQVLQMCVSRNVQLPITKKEELFNIIRNLISFLPSGATNQHIVDAMA